MAGMAMPYRLTITGPDGKPVTGFAVDQTKKLHFYAIRSDLTGFQHQADHHDLDEPARRTDPGRAKDSGP